MEEKRESRSSTHKYSQLSEKGEKTVEKELYFQQMMLKQLYICMQKKNLATNLIHVTIINSEEITDLTVKYKAIKILE